MTTEVWRIALGVAGTDAGADAGAHPDVDIGLLDTRERELAAARGTAASRRYTIAHVALREILGGWLGRAPRAIIFEFGEHGRPEIADRAVRFNLSHSGEVALVAVTSSGDIGVDVERVRPRRLEPLARRVLTEAEYAWWSSRATDAREEAFHIAWTRKEAVLKASGRGVAALRGVEATPAAPGWRLDELEVRAGYVGALAQRAGGEAPMMRDWSAASGRN